MKVDKVTFTISGIPVEKLVYVGELIRNQRERRGMSLRSVSRIVRRSPSYVSKLERGQVLASAELYTAICEAVGLNARPLVDALGVMDRKTLDQAERAFRIDPAAFRDAIHQINTGEVRP